MQHRTLDLTVFALDDYLHDYTEAYSFNLSICLRKIYGFVKKRWNSGPPGFFWNFAAQGLVYQTLGCKKSTAF